jgi:hypothetical protein
VRVMSGEWDRSTAGQRMLQARSDMRAQVGMADVLDLARRVMRDRACRLVTLICLDEPARIYHRHPNAARNTEPHQPLRTLQHRICADCLTDPRASITQRLLASILLREARSPRPISANPRS